MGFKKFNGKNAILSMILCGVASFSLLHANNLKECQSEEDKKSGCVENILWKWESKSQNAMQRR